MTDAPTFLSLFAGIGGFDLALERAGFRCLGQVEIDPFCTRVLAVRFPSVPRWGDVRTFGCDPTRGEPNQSDAPQSLREGLERSIQPEWAVDLLVGGFPCQDFSVAGKRAGLVGYRGTLFWEIVRIAKELTPPWGLFENVPGLLSSRGGRDFWTVLQGLRDCWPAVGWRVLDSRYFGVAQRRRRVFFVCGPSEAAVASVLFESEGGGGHPTAGREAGAELAKDVAASLRGVGGSPRGFNLDAEQGLVTVAATLNPGHEGKHSYAGDGGTMNLVVGPLRTNPYNNSDPTMEAQQLVHGLTAEGHDASEDGTGRGTPLVIGFSGDRDGQDAAEDVSPPLVHRGDDPSAHRAYGKAAVSIAQNQRGEVLETDYSHQLTTGGGKPGEGYPAARIGSTVRRLTPMECERLQAFPDGWTCLCQPLEGYAAGPEEAAGRCRCPDGPRYRALGNAVTVSAAEYLSRWLALAAWEEGKG